jgi:hypothetical protein
MVSSGLTALRRRDRLDWLQDFSRVFKAIESVTGRDHLVGCRRAERLCARLAKLLHD